MSHKNIFIFFLSKQIYLEHIASSVRGTVFLSDVFSSNQKQQYFLLLLIDLP